MEVTSSNVGSAPFLPELLNQIPPDEDVDGVTPDGAYVTRKRHEAISVREACAIIPPCITIPGLGTVTKTDRIPAPKPL